MFAAVQVTCQELSHCRVIARLKPRRGCRYKADRHINRDALQTMIGGYALFGRIRETALHGCNV
jgi:hypothetical protein